MVNPKFFTLNHSDIDIICIGIINCCGIANKYAELQSLISLHNLDIILGSESHLEADAEVFSNHFCVYRKDRNLFGGGVFILISKSIPSYCLNINSDVEEIWASLHLSNVSPIIWAPFIVLHIHLTRSLMSCQ